MRGVQPNYGGQMDMNSTLIVQFDDRYAPEIRRIRREVFGKEQGVDVAVDFDGQDPLAIHVVLQHDGQIVATGRVLEDGHIGRLAVLKPYRRMGLGSAIVVALIEEAAQLGLSRVYLGAQTRAVEFYRKLDFTEYGEPFVEAGIDHIAMQKAI